MSAGTAMDLVEQLVVGAELLRLRAGHHLEREARDEHYVRCLTVVGYELSKLNPELGLRYEAAVFEEVLAFAKHNAARTAP